MESTFSEVVLRCNVTDDMKGGRQKTEDQGKRVMEYIREGRRGKMYSVAHEPGKVLTNQECNVMEDLSKKKKGGGLK